MINYDKQLLTAYDLATKSPDPSTQNGAVLINWDGTIVSTGFNTFPMGVKITDERWERPGKYYFIEHAERNSILFAARAGTRTLGLTMVCPWAACADCARAIVQAGIQTLVRHHMSNDTTTTPDRWQESCIAGDQIMTEGGVKIIEVDAIPGVKLRRNGVLMDTKDL